jgi:hypothetical protein
MQSVRSSVNTVLRSGRFGHIFASTALGYWLLTAFSEGIIQFYAKAFNLAAALGNLPNPEPVTNEGWYYLGVIWFPNDHFQVTLLAGPVFFSILLSILFGLSMSLLSFLFASRCAGARFGLAGFLGFIPSFFSSAAPCCAAPLGTLFLSTVAPSAALVAFSFTYEPETKAIIAILMLLSIVYISKKTSGLACKA